MATGAAMAKSHEGLAGIDRFMEDFRRRFGHPFETAGYHGHPCFGYNCRRCGIHISLVRPRRWLKAERKGEFLGLALPEFTSLKAGMPK